ncbi:MAG: NRDE family protein [Bacteroidota bacterium]
MCTVTFIPSEAGTIITSNRDEHISRKATLRFQEDTKNGTKVMYPKDRTAGGTWFAVNEFGTVVVLLNGAFQNHKCTPPYRKSRGLLVLEIISAESPIDLVREMDLGKIEPFTLIIYGDSRLWEFRWDYGRKHLKQLNRAQSYIWSSWTLYDEKAQATRNQYFKDLIAKKEDLDGQEILDFHRQNHGDFENGFVIDRGNGLKTLSVTQAISGNGRCRLSHLDLDTGQHKAVSISTTSQLIPGS